MFHINIDPRSARRLSNDLWALKRQQERTLAMRQAQLAGDPEAYYAARDGR